MAINKTILGLRYAANYALFPNQKNLRIFPAKPKEEKVKALFNEDLRVNDGIFDISSQNARAKFD